MRYLSGSFSLSGPLFRQQRSTQSDIIQSHFEIADVLLILLAMYYCVVFCALKVLLPPTALTVRLSPLHISVSIMLLYACLSMTWSNLDAQNYIPMTYTLLCTSSALVVSLSVLSRSTAAVNSLLIRLTGYLSGVCLLYFLESLIGLGLRSANGLEILDFGIQRLRGPLFGSSVGHILIIPCLAISLDQVIAQATKGLTLVWSMLSTIFLASCLSLGSRAAIICVCCFALTSIFGAKGLKRKVLYASVVTVLGGMSALMVFSQASTERLRSFEDSARASTYDTAFRVFSSSWQYCLFGSGYGSIWPWYLTDMLDGGPESDSGYITTTAFGETLYHPHSTLALLGAELGIPGLLSVTCLGITLLMMLLKARRINQHTIFAAGIVSSRSHCLGTSMSSRTGF